MLILSRAERRAARDQPEPVYPVDIGARASYRITMEKRYVLPDKVMTLEEIAAYLGLDRSTVIKLLRRGEIRPKNRFTATWGPGSASHLLVPDAPGARRKGSS
jgi:helix-turn-helix protein